MRSKLIAVVFGLLILPGCMFLSNSEVQTLKDRIDILEKRAEINEHQRKLLEPSVGVNSPILKILDQNTTIVRQSATTIGNIVGRNPVEQQ